ncbi:MAG: ABC transporter substrate-binding protein [Firmicutes bacterium]|nr:ABC transporter substrate-binding protein [Bacillota bacterium]
MKTLSKITAAFLSLAMVVSMAACSSSKSNDPSSVVSTETQKVKTEINVGALYGPTGVSMAKLATKKQTFTNAYSDGSNEYINNYNTTYATEPTEIVGLLSSKDLDVACVPTNLAAKLYKVTNGNIKVAAVSTLGVLYMIDTSGTVKSVADLAGKTLEAPSSVQGSNPEYIINYLIAQNNITDANVSYQYSADELAAKIVSGDVSTIMLPEPKCTAVKNQLTKAGVEFTVTDLQAEWSKVSDTEVAQGVVVVRADWLEKNEGAFKTFLSDFDASSDAAVNDLDNTVSQVVDLGVIPNETLAKQAIPNCNIVCKTGEEMKSAVSAFIQVLFDADPKSIGGAIPDDAFYYIG